MSPLSPKSGCTPRRPKGVTFHVPTPADFADNQRPRNRRRPLLGTMVGEKADNRRTSPEGSPRSGPTSRLQRFLWDLRTGVVARRVFRVGREQLLGRQLFGYRDSSPSRLRGWCGKRRRRFPETPSPFCSGKALPAPWCPTAYVRRFRWLVRARTGPTAEVARRREASTGQHAGGHDITGMTQCAAWRSCSALPGCGRTGLDRHTAPGGIRVGVRL